MMRHHIQKSVTGLFLVIFLIAFGVIIKMTISPPSALLAYPPTTITPYPGQQTATPMGPSIINGSPWPTPTPYAVPTSGSATIPPRHGMAAPFNEGVFRDDMAEWAYHWADYLGDEIMSYNTVPMLDGSVYEEGLMSRRLVISRSSAKDFPYWTVFNECEHNWQCDASPEEAADYYHQEVLRFINTVPTSTPAPSATPEVREQGLIIGGGSGHPCGIEWLREFVHTYKERYGTMPPRAGWHFHVYPGLVADAATTNCNEWYFDYSYVTDPETASAEYARQVDNILNFLWEEVWSGSGEITDEIWITEMGCLLGSRNVVNGTPEYGLQPLPGATFEPGCDYAHGQGFPLTYHFVAEVTGRLQTEWRWIDRYAWYPNWEPTRYPFARFYEMTAVPTPSPQPTPATRPMLTNLGAYYDKITPAPAQAIPTFTPTPTPSFTPTPTATPTPWAEGMYLPFAYKNAQP